MNTLRGLLKTAAPLAAIACLLVSAIPPAAAYVDAYTAEKAEIYGATVDNFYVWDTYDGEGTGGVITSSYNYPLVPVDPTSIMIVGTDTVAAMRTQSAYAHADAKAGVMKAYAYSSMSVWGRQIRPIAAVAHSAAYVDINESFVLSEAATVTLAGTFHGVLGGDTLMYDHACCWDPAEAGFSISLSYDDGTEGGVRQGIGFGYSEKGTYNETFSRQAELPAGVRINFRARLSAECSVAPDISGILQMWGISDPGPLTMVGGNTWTDLANTASFKLYVPEGVTVNPYNAGSELLLPVEVQPVPEPSTLLALASGLAGLGFGVLRRRR